MGKRGFLPSSLCVPGSSALSASSLAGAASPAVPARKWVSPARQLRARDTVPRYASLQPKAADLTIAASRCAQDSVFCDP